ncbi:DNA polymerase [Bryobacterales bacterium F-183]|nr:DNA polymerase [Bryobacterales bacterium F-183]
MTSTATATTTYTLTPEEELHWLALRMATGLGASRAVRILNQFRTPKAIFHASKHELEAAGLAPSTAQSIVSGCAFEDAITQQNRLRAQGAQLITYSDPRYPMALKQIYDPPVLLYARGRIEILDTVMLAVVGTRRPTAYGLSVTERLASELSRAGLTIVSGMARGIDTAAHRAALESGGNTIAVFGSGLDHIYPSENRKLAERLFDQGLVLSEFPLGTPGYPQNFPVRNRIVAGLSVGVLIVEGAQYSGSAITARLALDQCREVYAVPGNITSKASWGPNLLIKQGAKLVQEASDVLDDLNSETRRHIDAQRSLFGNSQDEEQAGAPWHLQQAQEGPMAELFGILMRTIPVDVPVTLDGLIDRVEGWSSSEIISVLFDLEMAGAIRQLPGKQFVKRWKD